MRRFLSLILCAGFLAAAGLSAQADEIRTIAVSGEGQVSLPPDMATITMGVQTEAEIAADALDAASEATFAILARLDTEGVAAEDVQTGAIRLQPRYGASALSSGNRIIGYQAINSVTVQVTDLDRLGGLLAALVGDGANRLDHVSFGLQDPSAATDEARRRAVADARRKAALYADTAEVAVGAVLSISEQGGASYRAFRAAPEMMDAMASSPAFDVPVAAGQIDVSASIQMVFAIAE